MIWVKGYYFLRETRGEKQEDINKLASRFENASVKLSVSNYLLPNGRENHIIALLDWNDQWSWTESKYGGRHMKDIVFNCPHCQQMLEASEELLGQKMACPTCNGVIELPESTREVRKFQETTLSPKTECVREDGDEYKIGPKQRALLMYLGINNVETIGAREGERLLREYCKAAEPFRVFHLARLLKKDRDLAWPWIRRRIRKLFESWHADRLVLYPRLYQKDLFAMLEQPLRSYVRSEVVGASEKLTKERICEVILCLSDKNPRWWQSVPSSRNDAFMMLLREMYPNCCDGKKPLRKGSVAEEDKFSYQTMEEGSLSSGTTNMPSRGSGCCVVLAAIVVAVLILVI